MLTTMTTTPNWRTMAAVALLAGTASYFFLDRPIAYFAHEHLRQAVFVQMQRLSEPLLPAAVTIAIVTGGLHLSGRTLARWQKILFFCSVAILATTGIADELKGVFGRTWPETWSNNNPSLIRDGVFGFNPGRSGRAYSAFPSGHTADIATAATLLWALWPRLWPISVLAVAVVVVGLVGANYHFLSDMIGGGFLGASVALATLRLSGLLPAATQSQETPAAGPLTPPARS
jgi:membrane-associated phospholipid phosphatase